MKFASKLVHGGPVHSYHMPLYWPMYVSQGRVQRKRVVLPNDPDMLHNVISMLRNVPGVLPIHPRGPRVSGNGFFLTS